VSASDESGSRVRRKITVRLVAPLTFLTFLNSLDRVNVSFAALQMNADLGLDPKMYGFGVGIAFFSYILFQFPHTHVLRKIGARKWIFAAVLIWGIVATSMAFMQSATQFYALRFLLGAVESGFVPGIIYYISQWMPRRFRAWAIAGSMLAIPISVIFGGPLSGWLMTLDNAVGLAGWRFMFLIEGGLTVLAAFAARYVFVDRPDHAAWLDDEERMWLLAELAHDESNTPISDASAGFSQLIRSVPVWASAGVWFGLLAGAYGILYWLPQIIQHMSGAGELEVSILSSLPWIGLGAGMLVNAWHCDKFQERYWHIGGPALVAALCLSLGTSVGSDWLAFACLIIGTIGLGSAQGAFWALPTSFLGGDNSRNGITLINVVGTSAGFVIPPLIGWLRMQTGAFSTTAHALALILVIAAALLIVIRRSTSAEAYGLNEEVN
jgi:ACS family tartrate transporter-like MFS transporter